MAVRVIREEFNSDYRGVIIDDHALYESVRDYVSSISPELADRVEYFDPRDEQLALYEQLHIHEQLHKALDRKVWLPSGGSLIIERTEALTVIDVNTGKNVGRSNLEETVFRNNLEAATEIARQLRLRDVGGIIVVDFVDMDKEGNRRKVWDAFQKALSKDRARTNVTKISELGLVEMTRKRTRESLVQLLTEPCPTCEGAGVVKSVTTVAYEILREVRRSGMLVDNEKIEIEAAPRVAEVLQKQEREYLDSLEKRFQKLITVIGQKGWKPDQYRVAGKMSTEIAAQAAAEAPQHHVHKNGAAAHGGGGGGGGGRRRRRRGGRGRERANAST